MRTTIVLIILLLIVPCIYAQDNVIWVKGDSITVTWDHPSLAGANEITFDVVIATLDTIALFSSTALDTPHTMCITQLGEGEYLIGCVAIDRADNTSLFLWSCKSTEPWTLGHDVTAPEPSTWIRLVR